MATSSRINQGLQSSLQTRVRFRQKFSPTTNTAKTRTAGLTRVLLAMLQLTDAGRNGIPGKPCSGRDSRDAAPTECGCFGSSPLSTHTLVHHRRQSQVFLSYPFDCCCVLHAATIVKTSNSYNTNLHLEAFFGRFHKALKARGLVPPGITTDGSSLDPKPIAAVCGAGPHQVCTFHVLHALIKAVLSAVAKVARAWRGASPSCRGAAPPRRPPSKKQIEPKVGDLVEHRHLCVTHRLSLSQRSTLRPISRGLPQLCSLRGLMEEVDRLFDRRCRRDTALAKLEKLRTRLRRFGRLRAVLTKRLAPGLEKALVFLDERLAAGDDVQRGGARQPSVPENAEDGLPGADPTGNRGPLGAGPAAREAGRGRVATTKALHKARAA